MTGGPSQTGWSRSLGHGKAATNKIMKSVRLTPRVCMPANGFKLTGVNPHPNDCSACDSASCGFTSGAARKLARDYLVQSFNDVVDLF